jgi:N-acetylglutamate synthase-like GNAT family acetyltransferase
MVVKLLGNRVLYASEEFYIKEAGWRDTRELHQLFKETFSEDWKGVPGSKFTLVALDKQNHVIGGIERAIDKKTSTAEGVSFAVLPEFRGRGVGTALLKTMDAELKKMGIEKVITLPTESSWNIFRKNGYDYPPDVKAELRMRNVDEKEYIPGERLMKKL